MCSITKLKNTFLCSSIYQTKERSTEEFVFKRGKICPGDWSEIGGTAEWNDQAALQVLVIQYMLLWDWTAFGPYVPYAIVGYNDVRSTWILGSHFAVIPHLHLLRHSSPVIWMDYNIHVKHRKNVLTPFQKTWPQGNRIVQGCSQCGKPCCSFQCIWTRLGTPHIY